MAYISSSGTVEGTKSLWRLSTIAEFILAVFSFILIFFKSLFSPATGNQYSTVGQERRKFDGRGGGAPGEDRRIGRLNFRPSHSVSVSGCASGNCGR